MWYQNEKAHSTKLSYVTYASFILNAGGCPCTESPKAKLIGVIKQMTFQEIPYMAKGIQLSL